MSTAGIELFRQRRDELNAIEGVRSNWDRILEWHTRTKPLIRKLAPDLLEDFNSCIDFKWTVSAGAISMSGPGGTVGTPRSSRSAADIKNDEKAQSAKQRLLGLLGTLFELQQFDSESPADASVVPLTSEVFVVHGHDDEMKQHVARTLSTLGLNPIILHEKPNAGKTLIEKFETNATVSYAVVLLSPDDMAYIATDDPSTAEPRPRQNVILELGFFIGRLGRSRVFALRRDEIEWPSDVGGIAHTDYDKGSAWRLELVRELQAAGYDVDANALTRA